MLSMNAWLILLLMLGRGAAIPFNQPKFCSPATWNTTGITFANQSSVGFYPQSVFININNTVYAASHQFKSIQVWFEGNNTARRINTGFYGSPYNLFVTIANEIYTSISGYVGVFRLNLTNSLPTLYTSGDCSDLFIDNNNSLYCSISFYHHQVIKRSLNSSDDQIHIVAGTECHGSLSNMLHNPYGIFVHINFDLYVADSSNNRIQMFPSGQIDAITVAGDEAHGTISLNSPSDVILDADGYLFIVDTGNHRIVASESKGFRCIVGCSGGRGSATDQLSYPWSIAFDSYGNLFVADWSNHRIQKFLLVTGSCKSTTAAKETTTPITNSGQTITASINNSPSTPSLAPLQQSISYNRPKLCAMASWNSQALTFAESRVIGNDINNLFVNINDTIYIVDGLNNSVHIWFNGDINFSRTIPVTIGSPSDAVFVTSEGDIYFDNSRGTAQIQKLSLNGKASTIATHLTEACTGLFIDINNTLYYSVANFHRVTSKSLYDSSNITKTIAGTGCRGSTLKALDQPYGLFVDINFSLYVADFGNHRIQLFHRGQLTAITVAGTTAPGTIELYKPTGIVLDADGYLFIVDWGNSRIVRSGPTSFRCVAGCSGTAGSGSDQLYNPRAMAFDSYGNIFVIDGSNHRIQKFLLADGSCGISYNQPRICPSAVWNSSGKTLINRTSFDARPGNIFIDVTNATYVISRDSDLVRMWSAGATTPWRNLSAPFNNLSSIFVTSNADIYASSGIDGEVVKWEWNTTNSTLILTASSICYSIFVDMNNTFYCSIESQHQIVKYFLDDNNNNNTPIIAAGNGSFGSLSNMLNLPMGIFVSTNSTLYVADCGNDRIQLFAPGNLDGMTLFGNGSSATITLNCPTGVVLDADDYLFIADGNNHRILRAGPNGFQCT